MLTIDVAEARDRLPELLALVAAGMKVTITDGDRPVAVLKRTPRVPTPEEVAAFEAERRAKAEEAIRAIVLMRLESGDGLPPDSPLWTFIEPEFRPVELPTSAASAADLAVFVP